MINDGIELCEALQEHIKNDATLSYIENIEIQLWEKDDFPAFDKYGLVISPESFSYKLKAQHTTQETFYLEVVCIVKKYHPENALLGKTLPDKGIIKIVFEVWKSLFRFYASNEDLDVRYNELSDSVKINTIQGKENQDFYYWVSIPTHVKLKEKTFKQIKES